MFEFMLEKEQKPRRLTDAEANKTAADIGSLWKTWDDARAKQKAIAERLRPEIYLDERERQVTDAADEWKSDVHLNKIYSLNQTQQAYIWDNIYSDIDHLFDVEGADEISEETAAAQKSNLVNILTKIGIQRKLDAGIEYWGAVGEVCLFVSWKTVYRQIRRRLDMMGADGLLYRTGAYGIFNEEVYNGANVEAIDPLNLVWDPKVSPEDAEKFNACGKIIKSWETYDAIALNKYYRLSKGELEAIKTELNRDNRDEDEPEGDKSDLIFDGNRVEVLQYWGNFTLDDGTVLRNWHAVAVGRKYLAVFEPNRWVINPIINCATLRDAGNKRGIPELWSIYDICKEQEKKVNLQNDAQALNLNQPCYAPKDFFKEDKIRLFPGKVVTYKEGFEDPNAIIKMQFPLISNEQIIEYYDTTASSVSGIFPNMQGQDEVKDATATEIKVKVQGQTTRLSKILDTIKQNAIVPMVEKVADLEANMKTGDELLYMNTGRGRTSLIIGDTVRQGHYEYKYTDNTGLQKKLVQNQTMTQILGPVWNDPQVVLKKEDIVRDALINAGIENAEKYFGESNPQQAIPALTPPPDGVTFNQGEDDGQQPFGAA